MHARSRQFFARCGVLRHERRDADSARPCAVLMATKPVDFRKGANGLAALVKEQLRSDPFSGVIFCFRSKRADRVKLIFWDGTGLCLFAKRLKEGKFQWPRIEDGVMRLSAGSIGHASRRSDWKRIHARRVVAPGGCAVVCGEVNSGARTALSNRFCVLCMALDRPASFASRQC